MMIHEMVRPNLGLTSVVRDWVTHRASPAERVYLKRRRLGKTQAEMAKMFGLKTKEWRLMEVGESKDVPLRLYQMTQEVMQWEWCLIWRRRHNWTLLDLAERMDTSHVTVVAHERGRGNWSETYNWWVQKAKGVR